MISLSADEIGIMTRVLAVPIHAFGLDKLINKTGFEKSECVRLIDLVKKHNGSHEGVGLTMEHEDFKKLLLQYDVSVEIIDPIEMHTLVAFSWDEAIQLSDKLHKLISE